MAATSIVFDLQTGLAVDYIVADATVDTLPGLVLMAMPDGVTVPFPSANGQWTTWTYNLGILSAPLPPPPPVKTQTPT
jgi:hypothetical protein